MNIIRVPQLAWYETKELELPLPDSWQVEVYNMAGYNRPVMKPDEIKASISNPIGIPPIRELARGKKEVVIIFDDMTRVTRAAKIVPFVLEELAAAGIPDNRIRFIVALGLHSTMWRQHFVKKLGEEIVARFPVYNHNPFGNCTYVGTTATYKTKVYANEEVMKCDLKIAIGSVVPHPMSGFGGGGKIILPGVVSFETIDYNHQMAAKDRQKHQDILNVGMGIFDNNLLRSDIDEAAKLVGVDVLINCIVNTWGESVAMYTGAMEPAYAAAVQEAKTHYLTPRVKGKDIIIANTFAKVNETRIGLGIAYPAVNSGGGDVVLIGNAPEGQVTHYLIGPFGKTTWAKQHRRSEVPQHVNHLIVYNEYPHPGSSWLDEDDKILYFSRWDDVLKLLQKSHGTDAKVAVYPNAEIQYCV
jgi:nickel-dependent lactate racemase